MQNGPVKIVHQDCNLLVVDKPGGIIVYPERKTIEKTLIDFLLKKYPNLKNVGKAPRYGIIHRLDKDTSGLLLIAKNKNSLEFLQKQFKEKGVEKKYLLLVVGVVKTTQGIIETFLARSPKDRRKQKVFLPSEPKAEDKKLRKALTEYRVIKNFKNYTLIEAIPKTGRKHQIRAQMVYLGHPIAGDKLYGFRKQPCPKGLRRHFLHAHYLKIKLPSGQIKEFHSKLAEDLRRVLKNLK